MTSRFAAALSEHPIPSHAIGEVLGEVLERLGTGPDLAVMFATAPHTGAIEDMAAAVRSVLQPGTLIGVTAESVLAGAREVEQSGAVVLWAGDVGTVEPVRLHAEQVGEGWLVGGLEPAQLEGGRTLLLLADPFSFPVEQVLARYGEEHPDTTIVGGLASAARGPGGNRLVLDDQILVDGAVGVLLDAEMPVATVVSQGCRPIGDPFTVTRSERNIIYELAGQPALERLNEVVAAASPDDRRLLQHGIHLGVVVDESRDAFSRGDFLIRNVLGADRDVGAIAVGDEVPVGAVVQFQVRDADSADEDLRELLGDRSGSAALVFTCNGRGTHLFGVPHHDAEVVHDAVDGAATAGMFCAGEIGPIGGRSHLHGFTASVVLFDGAHTEPN
jgi:small ligand-binding sensory domain FIST